jgi:hypothetical protein
MLERKKSDRLIDGHLCVYLVYFYPLRRFLPRQLCLVQHLLLFKFCNRAYFPFLASIYAILCQSALPDQRVPCGVFCETSPGAYVGAYTHKDCTRRTVRASLSDFPNFHRVLLHPTLYVIASHEVLAYRIPRAHRFRVVPPVPGPRPRATNFHGRLYWSTCYSPPRKTYAAPSLSQIRT